MFENKIGEMAQIFFKIEIQIEKDTTKDRNGNFNDKRQTKKQKNKKIKIFPIFERKGIWENNNQRWWWVKWEG